MSRHLSLCWYNYCNNTFKRNIKWSTAAWQMLLNNSKHVCHTLTMLALTFKQFRLILFRANNALILIMAAIAICVVSNQNTFLTQSDEAQGNKCFLKEMKSRSVCAAHPLPILFPLNSKCCDVSANRLEPPWHVISSASLKQRFPEALSLSWPAKGWC